MARPDDKNVRLCEAVMMDDLDGIRAELADGADVRARVQLVNFSSGAEGARGTAIHWASTLEITALLLDAGADIEALDPEGRTPLQRVVANIRDRDADLVELLLSRGANPNPPQGTLLQQALRRGVRITRMLLEAGATITPAALREAAFSLEMLPLLEEWRIRNSTGLELDKQLMLAARANDLGAVTTLLDAGADPTARDDTGTSSIDQAWKRSRDLALVLERSAVRGHELFVATLDDSPERVVAAATTAIDLDAPGPTGPTALMLAARYRRHAAMRALVARGAQIDRCDGTSNAVVHAIDAGNLEGMWILLELGATLDLVVDGTNPILRAACAQPDPGLLAELLTRGIDLAPYPKQDGGTDELQRLLRNARNGVRPIAAPSFASWSECTVCRDLPAEMGWCHSQSGNSTGEYLPTATADFETFGDLWKCQRCATFYAYGRDHDNGIADGWDSESLVRLSLDQARATLRALGLSPRIVRELDALSGRSS